MDQVFTAASHHDVLVLLVQIAVLLFTARILGEIAQRMGQPSVVGEILAGIVLGPSLLSGIFPIVDEWIVPQTATQGYLLELMGLLGVMFLLLITGLETDLALIRRQARTALAVAGGGLALPLLGGFTVGQFLPDELLNHPDDRLVFSLFIATALSISAIPVVAKVLIDLKLTRRDVGQTVIAAAMIIDTCGWILLSIVIGMAAGDSVTVGSVLQSAGSVLAFLVGSFIIGGWLAQKLLIFVQQRINSRDKILSLVILLMFIWGALAQALNLEALFGAFIMGILFSRLPSLDTEVIHKLESLALGIFAPIFFAIAGLKVNIINLLEPDLVLIFILFITVATFCKVTGVYIGARWIGKRDHWTAIFFGAGLNPLGSMGIIVATIGLSLGILNQDMFSIIVLTAIVTSLTAAPALRWALSHIEPEQQELERLRREVLNKGNIMANVNRVLLPVRVRDDNSPTQTLEAQVLERIGAKSPLNVTLMTVVQQPNGQSTDFLNRVGQLFSQMTLNKKVVISDQPANAILDEAQRGYDLLVIGASEKQLGSATVFSTVIDELIRLAPCPTLVVRGRQEIGNWQRILVPTTGSAAARAAAQVGFSLASQGEAEVQILQVVETTQTQRYYPSEGLENRQREMADRIVKELCEMGALFGVKTSGEVRVGDEPAATILDVARNLKVDLIVLGTSVRAASDHLYLGPRVERILSHAPCPVIVVNTP